MARGLTRQQVQVGVALRLLKDYLSVPAGTLGTVHTISGDRDWHFTVRWKSHAPIPGPWRSPQSRRMMPMECSLNLSEEDLQLFEIATDQDLLSPHPPVEVPLSPSGHDADQLNIPFREE